MSIVDSNTKNTTICLCMIVKNETHNLPILFKSVIDYIDGWCIFDTGSTDGTQTFIQNYFDNYNIQGCLYETEWVNFAHNRNKYLDCEFVKHFDYILTLDADEQLVVLNKNWKNYVVGECNLIKIDERNPFNELKIEYWNPYLFSSKISVKYEGVTHETLTFNQNNISLAKFHEISVIHNATTNLEKKCERDIVMINNELSSNISIPNDIKYRYFMYLGKSYARLTRDQTVNINNILNAKESFERAYEITQKANVYIPDENKWDTFYQIALIDMRLFFEHKKQTNWIEEMWKAYEYYPKRVEPLGCLICHYCIINDFEKAKTLSDIAIKIKIPKNDVIEVDTSVYEKIIPQYHAYIQNKYKIN